MKNKKEKKTKNRTRQRQKKARWEMLKKYADQDDNVALFCTDLSVDFPGYTPYKRASCTRGRLLARNLTWFKQLADRTFLNDATKFKRLFACLLFSTFLQCFGSQVFYSVSCSQSPSTHSVLFMPAFFFSCGWKSSRPLQIKFSNSQRPFLMSHSALPWLVLL